MKGRTEVRSCLDQASWIFWKALAARWEKARTSKRGSAFWRAARDASIALRSRMAVPRRVPQDWWILLKAERFDGVEAGRLPGGVVAEEDADASGDDDGRDDGGHREHGRPAQQRGDGPGDESSECDADDSARQAEQKRLGEKLR